MTRENTDSTKSTKFWDRLAMASIVGAATASAAVYEKLPERVAVHFDLYGQPDGWMSRPWAAAFLPAFALVLWVALRASPRLLPASDKRRLAGPVLPLVASATTLFVLALHLVILRIAIVPGIEVLNVTLFLSGMLFILIGLVLPRVRRNPIIGVRTAWALRSDENWARTQRVGGYAMVTAGLASVLAGAIGGPVAAVLAVVVLIGSSIVPVVYSLMLARRHDVG